MAINPSTQYPTQTATPDANYPYGGAQNITAPGDNTGTPWEAALLNDIFGMQQALLKSAGIVPSGSSDKVAVSQYLQSLTELVAGRGVTYDAGGFGNSITLAARINQEAVQSLYDGLSVRFTAIANNTGAVTVNVAGTGTKSIVTDSGAALTSGAIISGNDYEIRYDSINYVLHEALQKTGGTLLGELLIKYGTTPRLKLEPTSGGGDPQIYITDDTGTRRGLLLINTATGNLILRRYASDGTTIECELTLTNNGNVTVTGAAPTLAAHLTRKDYVDGKQLAGTIDTDTDTITSGNATVAGWGTSDQGIGVTEITHNLGTLDYSITFGNDLTGTSARYANYSNKTANTIRIWTLLESGTQSIGNADFVITKHN